MINLVGTFNPIRLAAEAMSRQAPQRRRRARVIVTTASVAAFDGQIGQAAYSASKAGVVGMTLPIARELARYGIRVMTLAPGIFETPCCRACRRRCRTRSARWCLPPASAAPASSAQLVKSICENPMLNGEVIRLDGALRMVAK